ncbi:hypothetical protein ES705_32166 [subsurface metagenome]
MKEKKTKFRKLRILIRKGKIDRLFWAIHFGGVHAKDFPQGRFPTCSDCEDFLQGLCGGGEDPLKCMTQKSGSSKWESF